MGERELAQALSVRQSEQAGQPGVGQVAAYGQVEHSEGKLGWPAAAAAAPRQVNVARDEAGRQLDHGDVGVGQKNIQTLIQIMLLLHNLDFDLLSLNLE